MIYFYTRFDNFEFIYILMQNWLNPFILAE